MLVFTVESVPYHFSLSLFLYTLKIIPTEPTLLPLILAAASSLNQMLPRGHGSSWLCLLQLPWCSDGLWMVDGGWMDGWWMVWWIDDGWMAGWKAGRMMLTSWLGWCTIIVYDRAVARCHVLLLALMYYCVVTVTEWQTSKRGMCWSVSLKIQYK